MAKNKLMKNAKDTVKLGVVSMGGMGAMGALRSVPGMPTQAGTTVGIVGSGLALTNVGQMVKNVKGIILPEMDLGHVFHQFTIKCEKRDELKDYLIRNGIGCGIYYPKPLHMHPHFSRMGYNEGDFPIAEKVSKQIISLPMDAYKTKEEINYICRKIKEFFR